MNAAMSGAEEKARANPGFFFLLPRGQRGRTVEPRLPAHGLS
jgi:hypothetical protein